jgi:hypothetical protein
MSDIDWARDRRRSARVDLLAELQGHVVTLDESIVVRQVSQGGLTIETSAPLSPRLTHDFRVTSGTRTALVRAKVAHSHVRMQGAAVSYLSGMEFVEPSPDAVSILEEIVALARDALAPDRSR